MKTIALGREDLYDSLDEAVINKENIAYINFGRGTGMIVMAGGSHVVLTEPGYKKVKKWMRSK